LPSFIFPNSDIFAFHAAVCETRMNGAPSLVDMRANAK
jgi:hypothetical protein